MFGVISSIIVNSVSTLSQNPFSYLKKNKAQVNNSNGFSKSDSVTVQSKKKKYINLILTSWGLPEEEY